MKEVTQSTTASGHHDYSRAGADMTIVLISAVVIGFVYVTVQGDHRFLYLLSNGLPPLLAFAAFAMATAGLLRNGVRRKNRFSIIWLGYWLGMLLWFLGESTWAVYALWYSIPNPFPSIADGFWLAGYAPLIFAILVQTWPFREFLLSRKMLTVVAAVFCGAGLLLSALIPSTYASNIGQSFVPVAVGLTYPLLDVALLVVALPTLFLYGRGTFWRPFLFITFGLMLTFVGDIMFTWTSLNGTYYDGSYFELFFHWSYLTLAYGFYLRFRNGIGTNVLE